MDRIVCVICGKSEGIKKNSVMCKRFHSVHVKCLKRAMMEGRFKGLFECCIDCLSEFLVIPKVFKMKKCLWCLTRVIEHKISGCFFTEKICTLCRGLENLNLHYLDCEICARIYCEECKERKHLYISSSRERCNEHSLCLNHLKLDRNCQTCTDFKNNLFLICNLCHEAVKITDTCCESGHFFCTSCLFHFEWSSSSCIDCEFLFQLKPESINSSLNISFDNIKIISLHRRCFECSNSNLFKVYKIPSCNNCYYCPKCLNNEKIKSLKNPENLCNFFFSKKKNQKIRGLFCAVCKEIPEGTSRFCEKFHFLCIPCRNFLYEVPKIVFSDLLQCECCVKELRNLREYLSIFTCFNPLGPVKVPESLLTCGHILSFFTLKKILHTWASDLITSDFTKRLSLTCSKCSEKIPLNNDLISKTLKTLFDTSSLKALENHVNSFESPPRLQWCD